MPPLAGLCIPSCVIRHWTRTASDYAVPPFDTTTTFSACFARHNAVRNCSVKADGAWCFRERPATRDAPKANVPRLTRIRLVFAFLLVVVAATGRLRFFEPLSAILIWCLAIEILTLFLNTFDWYGVNFDAPRTSSSLACNASSRVSHRLTNAIVSLNATCSVFLWRTRRKMLSPFVFQCRNNHDAARASRAARSRSVPAPPLS